MNLEQKAENYYQECLVKLSYSDSQTEFAKEDYKSGYNQCAEDIIEFLQANQKTTVKQVLEHLNGMK